VCGFSDKYIYGSEVSAKEERHEGDSARVVDAVGRCYRAPFMLRG